MQFYFTRLCSIYGAGSWYASDFQCATTSASHVYPFRCFQNVLNMFPCSKLILTLQIFMDAFHGCYKVTPHDCRHFATLYLALRLIKPIIRSFFRELPAYVAASALVLVFILALVAKFQPYKCKKSNTLDTILLSGLIIECFNVIFYYTIPRDYPKAMFIVVSTTLACVPPLCASYLLLSQSLPTIMRCLRRGRVCTCMFDKMDRLKVRMNAKDRPLLCHGSAAYNTFN